MVNSSWNFLGIMIIWKLGSTYTISRRKTPKILNIGLSQFWMYAVAAPILDGVIEIFFYLTKNFGRSMFLEIDSSCSKNECQGYVLQWRRDKCGRCLWLTNLGSSCVICLKILEASTVWNPNGLARFYLYLYHHRCEKLNSRNYT
jgi:hypothetical protein